MCANERRSNSDRWFCDGAGLIFGVAIGSCIWLAVFALAWWVL